jgi:hypothetical protein
MRYTMTYSRTFTNEYECTTMEQADVRAKAWAKNFPPGEVTILSIYAADYVAPAQTEVKLSKMEQMVEGMRKKINSMLPKEPA